MQKQLRLDNRYLKQNKTAKIKWIFNKQPPPNVRRRLNQLAKRYPGRFSWEAPGIPPCQEKEFKKFVDIELEKLGK
jgi:hypothetical protein